uniref:Uncharacterized protein n=1 Tax=Anopheles funestus TaxID=62324 RepID=A0A4Y0BEV3_ANOFN
MVKAPLLSTASQQQHQKPQCPKEIIHQPSSVALSLLLVHLAGVDTGTAPPSTPSPSSPSGPSRAASATNATTAATAAAATTPVQLSSSTNGSCSGYCGLLSDRHGEEASACTDTDGHRTTGRCRHGRYRSNEDGNFGRHCRCRTHGTKCRRHGYRFAEQLHYHRYRCGTGHGL